MEKLEVPQELREYDHILKMLTIVFPCTSKTIRVDDYKNDRAIMVAVFRENTSKKRRAFFSEPLVKYLWQKIFMPAHPNLVKNHLRRIKSEAADGNVAVARFLESVQKLEQE